jgi:hypothetical protein
MDHVGGSMKFMSHDRSTHMVKYRPEGVKLHTDTDGTIIKESRLRSTTLWLEPEIIQLSKADALTLINDLVQDISGLGTAKATFHLHGHTIVFQVKE